MNLLAKHHILAGPTSTSAPRGAPHVDLVCRLQQAWDRSRAEPPDPQLSLLGGEQ